jgi:hypothetical protein
MNPIFQGTIKTTITFMLLKTFFTTLDSTMIPALLGRLV